MKKIYAIMAINLIFTVNCQVIQSHDASTVINIYLSVIAFESVEDFFLIHMYIHFNCRQTGASTDDRVLIQSE